MTGNLNPVQPPAIADIVGLLAANNYAQPYILLDGIYAAPQVICIQESNTPTFVNVNAYADPSGGEITDNMTPHDCTQPALDAVSFDPF